MLLYWCFAATFFSMSHVKVCVANRWPCFRPTLQAAHDPEAFHAASNQEGCGKRALRQGKGVKSPVCVLKIQTGAPIFDYKHPLFISVEHWLRWQTPMTDVVWVSLAHTHTLCESVRGATGFTTPPHLSSSTFCLHSRQSASPFLTIWLAVRFEQRVVILSSSKRDSPTRGFSVF